MSMTMKSNVEETAQVAVERPHDNDGATLTSERGKEIAAEFEQRVEAARKSEREASERRAEGQGASGRSMLLEAKTVHERRVAAGAERQSERDWSYKAEARLDGLRGRSADLDGHYAMLEQVGYRFDTRSIPAENTHAGSEAPAASKMLAGRGYETNVNADGSRSYSRDGAEQIRDRGKSIAIVDGASMRDAVRLAAEKWGSEFRVTATDPERRHAAMKAMAAEGCRPMGMDRDPALASEFKNAAKEHFREVAAAEREHRQPPAQSREHGAEIGA